MRLALCLLLVACSSPDPAPYRVQGPPADESTAGSAGAGPGASTGGATALPPAPPAAAGAGGAPADPAWPQGGAPTSDLCPSGTIATLTAAWSVTWSGSCSQITSERPTRVCMGNAQGFVATAGATCAPAGIVARCRFDRVTYPAQDAPWTGETLYYSDAAAAGAKIGCIGDGMTWIDS